MTVSANALAIEGGAQIACSTAGHGKGGDVNVTVASDIVLPDPGPQITARSTGSGDAGSITVSAVRLSIGCSKYELTRLSTKVGNRAELFYRIGQQPIRVLTRDRSHHISFCNR